MDIELKPCPFCGSKDLFVSNYNFRTPTSQDIVCMNCPAGINGDKNRNCFDDWNKRIQVTDD